MALGGGIAYVSRTSTDDSTIVHVDLPLNLPLKDAYAAIDMSFTQKSVTGPPLLPGIYYMNKAYNMLLGRHIYEQSGADIIDYTFSGRYTSDVSGETYEIPLEFKSIPNIAPSCDVISNIHAIIYSTSTSVLRQQATSSSHGFSATFDLNLGTSTGTKTKNEAAGDTSKEDTGSVQTAIKYGLMFGHSSTSRSGKTQLRNGYEYSFSLDTFNTYYKSDLDWNNEQLQFAWTLPFLKDVIGLKGDPSNKTIMSFINNWGTHVLRQMQTGSYCKETAYASSTASRTHVEDFQNHVSSYSVDFIYWNSRGTDESENMRTGKYEDEVSYRFSDIYCSGEVEVTSSLCAGFTSKRNNPIVTSYELLPIWNIDNITNELGTIAVAHINHFFDHLLESMDDCAEKLCNSRGICVLDEDIWSDTFIAEWDGKNFTELWINADNDYCFCLEGISGADCDIEEECECSLGKIGCCCKDDDTCDEGICSPIRNTCVARDGTTRCGTGGEFISCNQGVVFGLCASGEHADCGSYSGFCPMGSYTGIKCGYSDLGTPITNENWKCDSFGAHLDCSDSEDGDILIGICGSGRNADCKIECQGHHGILCGSIDEVEIDFNLSQWIPQSPWGEFTQCAQDTVATGFCASATTPHCSDGQISHAAQIQCSPFKKHD
eukprot:554234_1